MLTVICGHRGRMTAAVMKPLLDAYERRESQAIYIANALWMLTDRLNGLTGAGGSLPRYHDLFPPDQKRASARAIRLDLLHGLKAELQERRKQDA